MRSMGAAAVFDTAAETPPTVKVPTLVFHPTGSSHTQIFLHFSSTMCSQLIAAKFRDNGYHPTNTIGI